MTKTVIITAGGIGKRMQSDLPKQFLPLVSKNSLALCIEQFYTFDQNIQILVTLPEEWKDYWQKWCSDNHFLIKHEVLDGGLERYDSIKNALKFAQGDLIAIHDGVRPLVSVHLITELFKTCEKNGTAIPVLALKESIRFSDEKSTKALNRKNYFTVQTPQIFKKEIIQKAYEIPFHTAITDDASLVEESGVDLTLVNGEEKNIKITTPLDLEIAKLLC